jgi:CRP-like cAMP-binding protein
LPSVTYAPDKQIFQQGDPVGFVRLVVSGIAKLSVPSKNRALLLAVRTSGSVLGGVPAVLGGDQIVTATAVTRCETRTMSVNQYLKHIIRGADPEVGEWLARQNAWEIREQIRRTIALATRSQEAHFRWLMVSLFQASHHKESDGSLALTFPLSVTEIARAMGGARSPISVIESSYVRRKLLVKARGSWVIPPRSPLHREVLESQPRSS